MKPQIVSVRNKRYFICEYTGAPCETRYFIPAGKFLKLREGCYASLPILLRHASEKTHSATELYDLKKKLEAFYDQPDIPIQPPLAIERVPLSKDELESYLMELDMGLAWCLIPKGESINDNLVPVKRQRVTK